MEKPFFSWVFFQAFTSLVRSCPFLYILHKNMGMRTPCICGISQGLEPNCSNYKKSAKSVLSLFIIQCLKMYNNKHCSRWLCSCRIARDVLCFFLLQIDAWNFLHYTFLFCLTLFEITCQLNRGHIVKLFRIKMQSVYKSKKMTLVLIYRLELNAVVFH